MRAGIVAKEHDVVTIGMGRKKSVSTARSQRLVTHDLVKHFSGISKERRRFGAYDGIGENCRILSA